MVLVHSMYDGWQGHSLWQGHFQCPSLDRLLSGRPESKIQQVLLATCIYGAEQNTAGRTQVRTVPVIMIETAVSREGSEQQRRAATICIYVTVDTR